MNRNTIAFFGAALLTAAAVIPVVAHGADRRFHASNCIGNEPWYGAGYDEPWKVRVDTKGMYSADYDVSPDFFNSDAYCPVESANTFTDREITSLTVWINQVGGASMAAQICISYTGSFGSSCSSLVSASGTGVQTLQFTGSLLNPFLDSNSHTSYVRVDFNGSNSNGTSTNNWILGYTFSN